VRPTTQDIIRRPRANPKGRCHLGCVPFVCPLERGEGVLPTADPNLAQRVADTLTMALYDWNPSYSVKVRSCDAEHIKLFALINDLHEAMQSGKGKQVIEEVVGELERYTHTHFSAEEALMAKANYPALTAHRAEHKKFVDAIVGFRKQGITGQSIAVLTFMNDWLTKHIMGTDQKYSAHLNAHGIS
jgi:hemerythrin